MKNLRAITFLSFTLLLNITASRLAAESIDIESALFKMFKGIEKDVPGVDKILKNKKIKEGFAALDKDIQAKLYSDVQAGIKNIEEDRKDIGVAAVLSSLIRILDKVLKGAQMEDLRAWLREVKYSVHTNTIHKLIMGLYPGPFAKTPHYTNAYVESLGYTANDWVLNRIAPMFTNIDFVNSSLQMIGTDKLTDMAKMYTKRVLIGILAHFTWGLEKCAYKYVSSKVR